MMNQREIGSEFWICKDIDINNLDISNNMAVLLSGRSALDFVCRDIGIKSIALPSYCCDTMVEPFIRNNASVVFYDVDTDEVTYNENCPCDAVLVIDYFGYKNPKMEAIAKRAKTEGKTVIYDSTHNLFGNKEIERYSDYSILSYRKWLYCNFAIVKKHCGSFSIPLPCKTNNEYISLRNKAAKQKSDYIINGNGDKQGFLELFGKANKSLQENYVDCLGEPFEIPKETIIERRRENAKLLISEISKLPNVKLWFPKLHAEDTPLFVPILAKDANERKQLREHLSAKSIYCPIHWPKSEYVCSSSDSLYERELSLICDQRYGIEDMMRQISVITEFYG